MSADDESTDVKMRNGESEAGEAQPVDEPMEEEGTPSTVLNPS